MTAEKCITQNVIERAGLRDTELPAGPHISGPHSQMYEAWFGMIDPPRDYSVFDMSWVGPAASLISTVADLNRFYGLLLAGEIVNASSLAQMQRTVPVISFEGKKIEYGLGLHKMEIPGHGTFWGHDGTVWGAGAMTMTRADGKRQMSVAVNFMRWNKLDSSGKPQHHPIDDALPALYRLAMCGSEEIQNRGSGDRRNGHVVVRREPPERLLASRQLAASLAADEAPSHRAIRLIRRRIGGVRVDVRHGVSRRINAGNRCHNEPLRCSLCVR